MSDQEIGAGHHAITAAATHRLFEMANTDGKVLGMTESQFFQAMDHWQGYADRSPLGGWMEQTPFGLGNTWEPSSWNPDAQRAHSMADPSQTGDQNLENVRDYIVFNMMQAKEARGQEQELECLGAAVHALEDSYSSAHVFRDPQNPIDPGAQIIAFNNFSPGTDAQTHDKVFDKVAVSSDRLIERGTDQAAAVAVAEMLKSYVDNVPNDFSWSQEAFSQTVSPFFRGDDIQVYSNKNDPAYQAQRDAHYQNEVCRDWASVQIGAGSESDPNMSFPDDGQGKLGSFDPGSTITPELSDPQRMSNENDNNDMSLPDDGNGSVLPFTPNRSELWDSQTTQSVNDELPVFPPITESADPLSSEPDDGQNDVASFEPNQSVLAGTNGLESTSQSYGYQSMDGSESQSGIIGQTQSLTGEQELASFQPNQSGFSQNSSDRFEPMSSTSGMQNMNVTDANLTSIDRNSFGGFQSEPIGIQQSESHVIEPPQSTFSENPLNSFQSEPIESYQNSAPDLQSHQPGSVGGIPSETASSSMSYEQSHPSGMESISSPPGESFSSSSSAFGGESMSSFEPSQSGFSTEPMASFEPAETSSGMSEMSGGAE